MQAFSWFTLTSGQEFVTSVNFIEVTKIIMTDLAKAKFNMIEQQVRPWEVLDPQVLEVFNQINRDHFVPDSLKGLAYADCQLPVIEGESMLPPTLEGRLLQALNLKPSDSILEIGTCSGYLTACLATLGKHVDSIDFNARAIETAQKNLADLNIHNVNLRCFQSIEEISPQPIYDAISVSAGSLPSIPDNLKNALVIGGRLFAVCGQSPVKHAQLMTRVSQNEWTIDNLFETDIADLA